MLLFSHSFRQARTWVVVVVDVAVFSFFPAGKDLGKSVVVVVSLSFFLVGKDFGESCCFSLILSGRKGL